MMYGRNLNIIITVLAVIGLFALLGDNLGMIASILTAVLLFYTGAGLLRRPGSSAFVLSGLILFIIGALVIAGIVSFWAGMVVLTAAVIWKQQKNKR
ncbi:hypothetical protein [Salibacterium halotolerans]|uniref:Uncharacterized protein n=1 Tax=Salibacterium halotolerans TaxID=1884432 RepID=A0A1I5QVN4_9BACI|nr:hypothetical protein [Salibacterium halotolerans]SFP50081.1 hypothetical protein SAMN05518683_10642 [Salibacterium halotolerans]